MSTTSRFPFKQAGHAGAALELRVEELRGRLRLIPPARLAERTGASILELGQGRGELHLPFLGSPIVLTYPDFQASLASTGERLAAFKHALLLYYCLQSDGALPAEKWISFADLPDGRIYATAFQGSTGELLSKTFLLDLSAFHTACQKAEGEPVRLGEAAYRFQAFPRMELLVVYHLGDEDFPSACTLLFDASASHYLTAEACAILGSMLTQKILRNKPLS
jgi:hypothetical protein